MKFRAKIYLKGKEEAGNLLQAFFEDFNSESSILIKGEVAELEVVFEAPPKEIAKAISLCENFEFYYGTLPEKSQQEQKTAKEETSEQTKQEVVEEEIPEQAKQESAKEEISEQAKQESAKEEIPGQAEQESAKEEIPEQAEQEPAKKEISKTRKRRGRKPSKQISEIAEKRETSIENEDDEKSNEVLKLDEIANQSTSYEEFLNSVVTKLNLGKKQDLFFKILESASHLEKVTWKELEADMFSKQIELNLYIQRCLNKKVADKFGNDMTLMRFIKNLITYQSFNFVHQNVKSQPSGVATTVTAQVSEKVVEKEFSPVIEGKSEKEPSQVIEEGKLEEESSVDSEEGNSEKEYSKIIEEGETEEEKVSRLTEIYNKIQSNDKFKWISFIPDLKESLINQPIEERIKYVLDKMGIEKMDERDKPIIFEIANVAIKLRKINNSMIVSNLNYDEDKWVYARMTFSFFINDFLKDVNYFEKVKLIDFLQCLQRKLLSQRELANLK